MLLILLSLVATKIVTTPKAYKDFENVISVENTSYLYMHKDCDHVINLVNSKQLSYRLIYNISESELSIVRVYIDKNLVNGFIRSS